MLRNAGPMPCLLESGNWQLSREETGGYSSSLDSTRMAGRGQEQTLGMGYDSGSAPSQWVLNAALEGSRRDTAGHFWVRRACASLATRWVPGPCCYSRPFRSSLIVKAGRN